MFYEHGFDSYSPYQSEICLTPEDNILVRNFDEASNLTTDNLFNHFDLNLSAEEINALNKFHVKDPEWCMFYDASISSESKYQDKELLQFMHSISSSEEVEIVASTITKLVNAVKITGELSGNTTSFYVKAIGGSKVETEYNEINANQWHYDSDDDNSEGDNILRKRFITLVGPSTIIYNDPTYLGEEFEDTENIENINKLKNILDPSKITRANFGQGSVFEPTKILHSFPPENGLRLAVVIFKYNMSSDEIQDWKIG